jgi:hypothetical protein
MPTPQDTAAFADKLARAGETDRFWRINRLEAAWNGCAYDERPSFWDTSVPMRDRAPAVQSQIVRAAGRRLVSLVFGERAFPKIKTESAAFGVSLSTEQSAALQRLVDEVLRVASLKRRMREVLSDGLRAGTTVALQSIRAGRLSVDLVPAKWCTPTFEDDGRTLKRLVVEYKFPRDGKWYVHRREIEAPVDVTYEPVEVARLEHAAIDWTKVPVAHRIPCAFVPAVWHRNMAESIETATAVDGHALAEGLEDEIGALDLELSQLYRNALYNGDPQMVRIGLDEPANIPRGQTASTGNGWASIVPQPALKKSVTNLWDLPTGSDAKMVESSGAGAQIIASSIEHLRRVIVDAMGIVLADPTQLGTGELSARALTLMAPMLATADDLRVEYGETLLSILDQLLRLCAMTPGRIELASLEAARPALDVLFARGPDGGAVWMRAPIALAWGEYFEPSWSDLSAAIDVARKANGDQPVMTLEESRALLAPLLGLEGDATAVAGEQQKWVDATSAALSPVAAAADGAAAVADTALNGAQTASLVEIGEKLQSGLITEAFARVAIRKAFPTFSPADVEEALSGAQAQPTETRTP